MKVTIEKNQTLIELRDVPLGSCVCIASRTSDEIYMRVASVISANCAWIRLNDGAMFGEKNIPGYQWELVEAEVVVHSK